LSVRKWFDQAIRSGWLRFAIVVVATGRPDVLTNKFRPKKKPTSADN